MSTPSSEEGSGIMGHCTTSSGLGSTGSLLFVPSDSSDVQTEITPPTSPTAIEAKLRTPRDILDASRRLGHISVSALQRNVTPTRSPKQFHHRALPGSLANDEAGYDADGDADGEGDGDTDGDEGIRAGSAGATATRPTCRPTFLRIDTRQHRRVASMLATRRTSPNPSLYVFGDVGHAGRARDGDGADGNVDKVSHSPLRARRALFPAIGLSVKRTTTTECYELRRRPRSRSRAEPEPGLAGLGIGFPEGHPLRSRAFTMPLSVSRAAAAQYPKSPGTLACRGMQQQQRGQRRSVWWCPSTSSASAKQCAKKPKPAQVDSGAPVCAPSPVRLVLRPTLLEVSPSPIEFLVGRTPFPSPYRDEADEVVSDSGPSPRSVQGVDESESDVGDGEGSGGGNYSGRTTGMMGASAMVRRNHDHDIEIERMWYAARTRKGQRQLDLSEPTSMVPASPEVTVTPESRGAWQ